MESLSRLDTIFTAILAVFKVTKTLYRIAMHGFSNLTFGYVLMQQVASVYESNLQLENGIKEHTVILTNGIVMAN